MKHKYLVDTKNRYLTGDWCALCGAIENNVDEDTWGITEGTYNIILLITFEDELSARNRLLREIGASGSSELRTLYNVLFEDLNKMPLYINTSFSYIASWRLKHGK